MEKWTFFTAMAYSASARLAQRRKQAERPVLRAPRAGQVLASANVVQPISSQPSALARELVSWSGSLLDPGNV